MKNKLSIKRAAKRGEAIASIVKRIEELTGKTVLGINDRDSGEFYVHFECPKSPAEIVKHTVVHANEGQQTAFQ